MKKIKFDIGKVLVYGAALYQAYQFGRALAILDPRGWEISGVDLGGLALGGIVNLTVATAATRLPMVAKKRKGWATIAFLALMAISPALVMPARYLSIDPAVGEIWRWILAAGYSLAPDVAIALGGFVAGKSLIPLLSETEQLHSEGEPNRANRSGRSANRTAKKPKISQVACRYAGAGCEEIFGSQNAENAHARWCKFKPTISMPAEVKIDGREK